MKLKNKAFTYQWAHIGMVGVDAGCLMIGDPCYSVGEGSNMQKTYPDWMDFINAQFEWDAKRKQTTTHEVPFNSGLSGAGVVAVTRYGDGYYPVYALIDADDPNASTENPHAMLVLTGDADIGELTNSHIG